MVRAQAETEPRPIQELNPRVPSSLANIVSRSLKKDPNERWQTAAEFRDALVAHQQNRVVTTASRPVFAVRPRLLYAALALVMAALVSIGLWFGRGRQTVQPSAEPPSIA